MRSRSLLVLAALVAAAACAPRTVAETGFPGADLPTLREGEVAGSGWVAFALDVRGGVLSFEQWVFGEHSDGLQLGHLLFDDRGRIVDGGAVTVAEVRDGLAVRTTPLGIDEGAVSARVDRSFLGTGGAWDGMNGRALEGEHTLLLWGAGAPASEWTWSVRGENVAVSATTSGDAVTLLFAEDFQGLVAAYARAGDTSLYRQASMGADVLVGAGLEVRVEERLAAVFDTFEGIGVDQLSVETPQGEILRCPCFLRHRPHGTYSFHLDQAALVAPSSSAEAFLSIVDYELPE